MNQYFLVTFTIKNKEWVNYYVMERKKVYIIAEDEQVVVDYINSYINKSETYNYTIESCSEDDLKGLYPTDGFSCVVIPKDDVLGKLNITNREWLVRWESREHDGEYAKVLRKENFIVKARNAKEAGDLADNYAMNHRFSYYEDSVFYTTTDYVDDVEAAKKSGKVIYV